MAVNVFEQYGIKEVADVIVNDIVTGNPIMYFDTLKVSNVEQTAEVTDARGGKGNSKLISWDYGKEITVTLQDALMSPKSLELLMGAHAIEHATAKKIKKAELVTLDAAKEFDTQYEAAGDVFILEAGAVATEGTTKDFAYTAGVAGDVIRIAYEVEAEAGKVYELVITPNKFPGTYSLVGDTVVRNRSTGIDEGFQFIIPKAKIGSEVSLTMEAEGDPTVFDMAITVLRADNGSMMSLVKYDIGAPAADSIASNLT